MIRVTVKTDAKLYNDLKLLLGDTAPMMADIAEKMLAAIRQQVKTRGARFGGMKWPEYSSLTLYSKRIRGPKGRMLEGLLKKIVKRSGKTFAEVRSDDKIVAFHDEGTATGTDYQIPKTWEPGKWIAYPHPQGRAVPGRSGNWFVTNKPVFHPGVKQRKMFPSRDEATDIAYKIIRARIKEALQ